MPAHYPRHLDPNRRPLPADPPGQVQCIICDVVADLVEQPGWSVRVNPPGWGHVTGLPGSRCPRCMAACRS